VGAGLTKLDVGTYTYPAAGAPQPHGVASITGTPGTTSFAYDSDGNVTAETGATTRSLGWTMFNMPASISYGTKAISFQYDADHNRVMQTAPNGTTYYLPDGEQTPGATTGPVWHTYFQADGERVVEDFGPTGSLKHHFFHNDYQNTIGLVTDDTFTEAGWPSGTGIVQNELSDVFGQPRLHTGAIDPNWGAADVTKRRYINQEDLTPVQLINLNARVYDPLLGKFMSPDPVISDQDNSQSWNAYAYVHNNPMSREDPTGLADCDSPSGCVVFGQRIPEGGFNGAHWASVGPNPSAGFLHIPSGILGMMARAANGSTAAKNSLAENYGINTTAMGVGSLASGSASLDTATSVAGAIRVTVVVFEIGGEGACAASVFCGAAELGVTALVIGGELYLNSGHSDSLTSLHNTAAPQDPNAPASEAEIALVPSGSYNQPNGGRTDVGQADDHGAGHNHTHDPITNTNPKTGETFVNGLQRGSDARPISHQDIINILNGAAVRADPKGR
jgi:RHS repeat-associated protein